MKFILATILIVSYLDLSHGYPSGAPERVCNSMRPGFLAHGMAQNVVSEYSVYFDTQDGYYGNGNDISGEILAFEVVSAFEIIRKYIDICTFIRTMK